MSVARYRDRHSVAGRKSDHGDSFVLANVLRTDLHAHRPLPADSELAQAIAVLARAQLTPSGTVPPRTTGSAPTCASTTPASWPPSPLRHRGPKPGTILAAAPTPADAAPLTLTQLRALLPKAGHSRGIDTETARLREAFRAPQMRQLPLASRP